MNGWVPYVRRIALAGVFLGAAVTSRAQTQTQPPPNPNRPAATTAQAAQGPTVATTVKNNDRIVKAVRIDKELKIDGKFDDEFYQTIEPITGFTQQDPAEGKPATESTDLWVFFDDKNVYFAGKCYDDHPEREIATELRRDSSGVFQNDSIALVIDTFLDRRNGFKFQTNSLGAVQESAVVDEVNNDSWNTVWEVRSGRYEWGWGFEMAVPFKSLRYPGAGPQTWGINMRRVVKWKNELDYLAPMPRSFGTNAIYHMGFTATLVGLETPKQSMNLELKPYGVSSVVSDRTGTLQLADKDCYFTTKNCGKSDVGFDFKYGLTRSLIMDATVNTDFAQVEEDQQQVNLTRYSLFFPEKRDFFLEGQATFAFGGVSLGQNANPGEVPVLFFSRQIGLSRGQAVPMEVGGRLTGRAGKFQVGAVNVQTGDKTSASAVSTNFSAVRVKRDFLRRSNIGFIATRRDPTTTAGGTNYVYGVDSNLFLYTNVTANIYYARTDTSHVSKGQDSYRGRFEYAGDRYGVVGEHLAIGQNFNPQVGYVKRADFRRSFTQGRFSPRPKNNKRVRRYSFVASYDYDTSMNGNTVQNKEAVGSFTAEYQNGDSLLFSYTYDYEALPAAFTINAATLSKVPKGTYTYQTYRTRYSLGQQRRISGSVSLAYGSLYEGHKTEAIYSGRVAIIPQFALEPSISLNWVRLPFTNGDFEAPVISSRIIFTPNARTSLTSFLQYNKGTNTMTSSVRLRWEYRPGSELFIVYSDGRNTDAPGFPDLLNRSFAIKMTRLLRF